MYSSELNTYNKFMRREFACEADARKQAEIWLDQHPFHKLVDLDIVTKCKRAGQKRGRPKKGEDMVTVYLVLARLEINKEILEEAHHKLGRFILASNDTEIDPDTLLGYYKGQQSVKRGFRFLNLTSPFLGTYLKCIQDFALLLCDLSRDFFSVR